MPNIASLFKSEIARVSRKEVRAATASLKTFSGQARSSIADLKRQLAAVQKQLRTLAKANAALLKAQPEPEEPAGGRRLRFSADGLASHRKKLQLSAEQYGSLVGVTGQSIYAWEAGRTRPRASQLPAIADIRKIGKREALARLSQ